MQLTPPRRRIISTTSKGKVYLVGAGPGSPTLLTIRAAHCLAAADVVLYDYLVDERMLRFARGDAELICVGKSPSQRSTEQDEINSLMIERAHAGKNVVRLKGGDPYLFGRGGEEAVALREAGVEFEVVPGITAAGALGAYAGIPLTHRGTAASVVFATGHEAPAKGQEQVNWRALAAAADTIVVYMGVGQIRRIVAQLLEGGMSPETPAAIVQRCAAPSQKTFTGTLAGIADIAEREGVRPPALIVAGKVVSLREKLDWFERAPLFGRTVLVTRPRPQAAEFSRALEEKGAYALEVPMISIEPPEDIRPLDEAIENLRRFDWLVFTSINGVEAFFDRLRALGRDARDLYRIKICCIGPGTASGVERRFLKVDCVPARFVTEEVAAAMVKCGTLREKGVLMPRSDIAPPALAERLRAMGACVTDVTAYRTVPAAFDAENLFARLKAGEIDAVTFTSSSTARFFVEGLGKRRVGEIAARTAFAVIGPATARTCVELGIPVSVEAKEHTAGGLADALVAFFDRRKGL